MDPEHDRMVSDHVLRMHQYRAPGEQDGEGTVIMTCCGIEDFYDINEYFVILVEVFLIATKDSSLTIPLLGC